MFIITDIDKFFHNSPGAERRSGTPHFTRISREGSLMKYALCLHKGVLRKAYGEQRETVFSAVCTITATGFPRNIYAIRILLKKTPIGRLLRSFLCRSRPAPSSAKTICSPSVFVKRCRKNACGFPTTSLSSPLTATLTPP